MSPATHGGFLGSAFNPNAHLAAARARLRNAAIITMLGGALLFLISFVLGVVTFAFSGIGAGLIVLVLGVVPGIAIILCGALMVSAERPVDQLVMVTVFCAVISLFATGGFLIGAIVSFVGAALARSASRELGAMHHAAPAPSYAHGAAPLPPPFMHHASPPPAYSPLPTFTPLVPPPPAPAYTAPPRPTPPPPPPAPLTPLERFLAADPERAFDLESLNALDFNQLENAATSDRAKRGSAFEKAEALLARLSADIADINTLDDILRDRLVVWYRDSPADPDWSQTQPARFAGLVSESRTAGGARTTALTARLASLRDATAPFEGPARRALKQLRQSGEEEPPAPNPVASQTVQAVLDDIAASPRLNLPAATLPLLRLSEYAVKATPAAVNAALADLFKADPRGPFIILHPSRFPDFEFVLIRPPSPRATGAAIAYDLVCSPAATVPTPEAPTSAAVPRIISQAPALDLTDPWSIPDITEPQWSAALSDFERRRERLPPPPSDFRRSPPYFTLRKLVISDAAARRTFLAIKWRGKPPALGLLAQLLTDGSLQPQFETDAEYLDAELSDIERGDPNWRPPTHTWAIAPDLRVARKGQHGAFSYSVTK